MPPLVDRYGLQLTTRSQDAADHYVEGVDRILAYNVRIEEPLEASIAADPGFALARAALANYHFYRGEMDRARTRAGEAVALASAATPRERAHVEIIQLMVTGKASKALPLIDAHLRDYPRDALVLLHRSGWTFYNGGVEKREAMFELFDPLAPVYGDDWWFLTWYAFSHHEIDRIEEARTLAARSLEIRRDNSNGVHAMAHVHFESGESDSGSDFMRDWFADHPQRGHFYTHLSWHHALFELDRGRPNDALAIYDDAIAPQDGEITSPLGALADGASFLWRCRLYGVAPAGLPWQEIAELATSAFPKAGTAWVDAHKGIALAALHDDEGVDALLDGLRAAADRGHPTAGLVVAPVVEAMRAFAHERYDEAADGLESVHDLLVSLGGSNAQRDVFEETLAEAYLRSGKYDKAHAFLTERLGRRTTARDLFRIGRAQRAQQDPASDATLHRAAALWADADAGSPETQELVALAGL